MHELPVKFYARVRSYFLLHELQVKLSIAQVGIVILIV